MEAARTAPGAEAGIEYPEWYLQRWHFLPAGYLSRRSVRRYDRWVRNLYTTRTEGRTRRRLVAHLRADRRQRILEVGCGPGWYLREFGRSLANARVVGVDLSPYMVERAGSRTEGLPQVEVRHADGTALPFADGEFDAAVMVHVLGHVPPGVAEAMVGEAARVVEEGGRLYVVDHAWHEVPGEGWERVSEERVGLGMQRLRAWRKAGTGGEDAAL